MQIENMKQVFWVEFAIGIWMVVSPWVLGFSEIIPALWSCTISGVLISTISLWQLFGGEAAQESSDDVDNTNKV